MLKNTIKEMLKNINFVFMETPKGDAVSVFKEENAQIGKLFYLRNYEEEEAIYRDILAYLKADDKEYTDAAEFLEKIKVYDNVKNNLVIIFGRNPDYGFSQPIFNFYKFVYVLEDNMKVRVTKALLKEWNVTEKDIFEQAEINTKQRTINFMKIDEFMYVLQYGFGDSYGATVLTNKNVLSDVAEGLKTDFYIIPSSIHELIIIPVEDCFEPNLLKGFVEEVNTTVLEEDIVLSDAVFRFSREEKRFSCYRVEQGAIYGTLKFCKEKGTIVAWEAEDKRFLFLGEEHTKKWRLVWRREDTDGRLYFHFLSCSARISIFLNTLWNACSLSL